MVPMEHLHSRIPGAALLGSVCWVISVHRPVEVRPEEVGADSQARRRGRLPGKDEGPLDKIEGIQVVGSIPHSGVTHPEGLAVSRDPFRCDAVPERISCLIVSTPTFLIGYCRPWPPRIRCVVHGEFW